MSAVVIADHVTREQYTVLQGILRQIYGQEGPTWAELVEHAAVEDDAVAVLVWPHHVSFIAPSRAREMFAESPRLSEQRDGTWA